MNGGRKWRICFALFKFLLLFPLNILWWFNWRLKRLLPFMNRLGNLWLVNSGFKRLELFYLSLLGKHLVRCKVCIIIFTETQVLLTKDILWRNLRLWVKRLERMTLNDEFVGGVILLWAHLLRALHLLIVHMWYSQVLLRGYLFRYAFAWAIIILRRSFSFHTFELCFDLYNKLRIKIFYFY